MKTDIFTHKEQISALTDAFHEFSQETIRLDGAYKELKQQFKGLYQALKEANAELKIKVAELDLTSRYLHTILSQISQGIIFVDSTGKITTYNIAAEKILKIESHKVLYQTFWNNFSDTMFGFSIKEAFKNKASPEKTYASLFGSDECNLEVNTTFVINKEGFEGIIILFRDVTDINKLQTIAHRNDRMKDLGEMAAMVAHAIRNPLGGIKGFASLLSRDLNGQPEQQKMAEAIIEGTDHLNHLISRVLNYLSPLKTILEPVNLVELANDIEQYILADASIQQKIQFDFYFSTDPFLLPLDKELFRSALFNLLVNAVQAMPEGGKITFSCEKKKNQAIISIADTGTGIPKEHLEKIFSPFFTTKPNGSGFGLSEVYKVVQVHHGTIEVASQLGKGTTFIIKIPIG